MSDVTSEILRLFAGLSTKLARIRTLPRVLPVVNFHSAGILEPFVTGLAFVGSLAAVNAKMKILGGFRRKPLRTHVTLVRLLSCVHLHMRIKSTPASRHSATNIADKALLLVPVMAPVSCQKG